MLSGPKRNLWRLKIVHLSAEVIKVMVLNLKRLGETSKQNGARKKRRMLKYSVAEWKTSE